MSKSLVWTVSPARARTIRSVYFRDARDSSLHTKRVPIIAACAPRASAATTPRPFAMPPAAITGNGFTASTTAEQDRERGRAAYLPARLEPLRDHCGRARGSGVLRLVHGADLHEDGDAGPVRLVDVWPDVPPEEHDHGDALLDAGFDFGPLDERQQGAHAERPRGQRPRLSDLLADERALHAAHAEEAEPARGKASITGSREPRRR
jgi:hypothetical protein